MARVLVNLSSDFLDEIDNLALNQQRSRSEYVREAIRSYLRHKKQNNVLKAQQASSKLEELLS